jgi:hypothetical protein
VSVGLSALSAAGNTAPSEILSGKGALSNSRHPEPSIQFYIVAVERRYLRLSLHHAIRPDQIFLHLSELVSTAFNAPMAARWEDVYVRLESSYDGSLMLSQTPGDFGAEKQDRYCWSPVGVNCWVPLCHIIPNSYRCEWGREAFVCS